MSRIAEDNTVQVEERILHNEAVRNYLDNQIRDLIDGKITSVVLSQVRLSDSPLTDNFYATITATYTLEGKDYDYNPQPILSREKLVELCGEELFEDCYASEE